jgi:hypothetical protein
MANDRNLMTEERFLERLAVYGADLSRWPPEEREAARRRLETGSHRLRDVWESEAMFDGLLAPGPGEPAPEALTRSVAASFRPSPRAQGLDRPAAPRGWKAGGAIAASLAIGLAAGFILERQLLVSGEEDVFSLSEPGGMSVLLTALNEPES